MTNEERVLVDNRARLITQMQTASAKTAKTSEDREAFDAMVAEELSLRRDIEQIRTAETLAAEMRNAVKPPMGQPGNGAATADAGESEARSKQERRELAGYIKYNMQPKSLRASSVTLKELPAEFRDMAVGTTTAGGYLVPIDFQRELEVATLAYGDSLKTFRKLHTDSGEAIQWPLSNDTTNYAVPLAEAAQVSEQDSTLSQVTVNSEMYTTKMVKISRQLLEDAAIDPIQIIKDEMAIRLARGLVVGTTNGTASTYTQGLLATGTINAAAKYTATGTGATVLVPQYADIAAVYGQLDPSYRPNATWMFSNSWFAKLLAVTDTLGRPLFIPNPNGDGLDRILGRPICINQSFPTLAVSQPAMLFGDFNKYILRVVGGFTLQRLDERFADYLQVAFLGFQRFGSVFLDAGTHPIQLLTLKAS